MYKEMYDRWLAYDLDDPDLKPELESIRDDDAAIQDRFAVALKFGTAGLPVRAGCVTLYPVQWLPCMGRGAQAKQLKES